MNGTSIIITSSASCGRALDMSACRVEVVACIEDAIWFSDIRDESRCSWSNWSVNTILLVKSCLT